MNLSATSYEELKGRRVSDSKGNPVTLNCLTVYQLWRKELEDSGIETITMME